MAILHYHDALELTFDLILEDKGIDSNNLSFMQCFDKVNEWLISSEQVEISLRPSLEKLKNRRVNLKHKGLFPSQRDIQESEFTSNTIFEELCKNIFDLDVKDISLVFLIENERVKNHILEAIEQYPDDQEGSMLNISLAFEFLLKDYETSKSEFPWRSPFFVGKSFSFNSSFFLKIDSKNPVAKFVDDTKETIESMQKIIRILAFGLNYKKYIKFRLLIPESNYIDSKITKKTYEIKQSDFEFCINYIIESALNLQAFDFEISKRGL